MHEPVDLLVLGPNNVLLNKQACDVALSPLWFGKDIHDCSLPALANGRYVDWTRQDWLQLDAGAADNCLRSIGWSCKAADGLPPINPLLQLWPRCDAQKLKSVTGSVPSI